jgi:hypothetical protein
MQLAKFMYGSVVEVTYWVSHSSSQGVFPRWILSKSRKEDGVDGGKKHGVRDIQLILSHLWVPL